MSDPCGNVWRSGGLCASGPTDARAALPLADDPADVLRGDSHQAGDDGEDEQPLDSVQQPGEQSERNPDDDESDNDLHGARLPLP